MLRFLLALLLASSAAVAQPVWQTQKLSNEHLNAVAFQTEERVWAVGNNGTVYLSTDAGERWTEFNMNLISTGTGRGSPHFNGIHFFDEQTGWIVGDRGFVAQTQDGGETWSQHTAPANQALYDVHALDAQRIWVAGNNATLYFSSNGGRQWATVHVPGRGHLRDVHFTDATTGWATGAGTGYLVGTRDGGETWSEVSVEFLGTQSSLRSLAFEEGIGWATGQLGSVHRTLDGGRSWQELALGRGIQSELTGVAPITAHQAVIVGSNSLVLYTQDAGQTWTQAVFSANYMWNGVARSPKGTVIGVGNVGWVLRSSIEPFILPEPEPTPTPEPNPLPEPEPGFIPLTGFPAGSEVIAIHLAPRGGFFLSAYNYGVYQLFDSTWVSLYPALPSPQVWAITSTRTPEGEETLLAGSWEQGLFNSTDGGLTWLPVVGPSGFAVALTTDVLRGQPYIVDHIGNVYSSTDGGIAWSLEGQVPGIAGPLGFFVKGDLMLIAQQDGMLRSTDGGATWNRPSGFFPGTRIEAIAQHGDGATLWAGTRVGLYRSTDDGATWRIQDTGVVNPQVITLLTLAQSDVVAMGTWGSGVHISTTGGMSWRPIELWNQSPTAKATSGNVQALAFHAGSRSLLAGTNDGGLLVYPIVSMSRPTTVDAESTPISRLTLYPNPARDAVRIALPASASGSRLVMHDLLGRTVLEADVPAFTEGFLLDARNLAAGTYLIRWEETSGLRGMATVVIAR